METEGASFDELIARLRAGDEAAAEQIFHRYLQRLTALARSRLSNRVRRKIDPEDIVQSVYNSFFGRFANGQFTIPTWESLWSVLVVMTLRRCGRWAQYYQAAMRDVGAERSQGPLSGSSVHDWEALADDPTPAEAAMLSELVERLLSEFDAKHREIVTMSLQGCSVAEISAEVGRSERTVQRVLEQVKAKLERMRAEDNGPA